MAAAPVECLASTVLSLSLREFKFEECLDAMHSSLAQLQQKLGCEGAGALVAQLSASVLSQSHSTLSKLAFGKFQAPEEYVLSLRR